MRKQKENRRRPLCRSCVRQIMNVFLILHDILFWYTWLPPFFDGRLFFSLFSHSLFFRFPFLRSPFEKQSFEWIKGYMGGWHLQYRVDSHSTFSCILLHTEIDHPFTCPLLFHSCKPLKFTPVDGTVDKWAGEERPGNDLLEPLR